MSPEGCRCVWEKVHEDTDQIQQADQIHPDQDESGLNIEPNWNYNKSHNCQARDIFITPLLSVLSGVALKPINFQQILEVVQEKSNEPLNTSNALLGISSNVLLKYPTWTKEFSMSNNSLYIYVGQKELLLIESSYIYICQILPRHNGQTP